MAIFKKPPLRHRAGSPFPCHVLIVDDEPHILASMKDMLAPHFNVTTAESGQHALDIILKVGRDAFQIIIADQRMPGMPGTTFLERSLEFIPTAKRVVLTGYTDFKAAVGAINRCHVSAFLMKPFEREELLQTIRDLFRQYQQSQAKTVNMNTDSLVGSQLRLFLNQFGHIPDLDTTVLIQGETGTGKEMVAKTIHLNSKRSRHPFVAVHCGAIPENLFEAELFGHTRGAFTGAHSARSGRALEAHKGTLFIDEVGEIPLSLQAKLLRFFQSKEIQRVGADKPTVVDVRFLAATHRNLQQMVADGQFREDLYYRLKVIDVLIPPLRERKGDVLELIQLFLQRFGKGHCRLSRQAQLILQEYAFPGNVRELENALERACALAGTGLIQPLHLPAEMLAHFGDPQVEPTFKGEFHFPELTNDTLKTVRSRVSADVVDRVEQSFLRQLMAVCDSVSSAARYAQMARPYLHRLLSKHAMKWQDGS